MNIGKAVAIFKQIKNKEYTDTEKLCAISAVLDMSTHNGITKDEILTAFRWFADGEAISVDELQELGRMNWISIKDRLPNPYIRVLAAFEDKTLRTTVMSDSETFLHEGEHGYVTHWQPLPEPPKGELK